MDPRLHTARSRADLTVIAGCMFSGKSEELLRLLRRAVIARQSTIVVKPAVDTRSTSAVCSRDGHCVAAIVVATAAAIPDAVAAFDIVGIDEAQFFDPTIVPVVRMLHGRGQRVIVAGLDADYRGECFGAMHLLMAIPEAQVVKLRAVCMRCGEEATRTFRKTRSSAQVEIGDAEKYEALCYACYGTAAAPPVESRLATTYAT